MSSDELLKELLGGGKKRDFDVLRYLRLLWRKKFQILTPLVLSWGIATLGLPRVPDTYRVGGAVAIESPSSFTRDLEQLLDEQAGRRQEISELQRVRSQVYNQQFLEGVIAELGLNQTPILREKAQKLVNGPLAGQDLESVVIRLVADKIRNRIDIRLSSQGLYNITVDDNNPELAYLLCESITRRFVDSRRQWALAEITAKGEFSDEQVAIYKEKLFRAEQELERYKQIQQATQAQGNPVRPDNVVLSEEVMSSYREELTKMESRVDNYRSRLREVFGYVPTNEQLLNDRDLRSLENKQIHTMLQNLVQYLRGSLGRADQSLTEIIEDGSVGLDRQSFRDQLSLQVDLHYASAPPSQRDLIVNYYYYLMLVNSFQEIVDTLGRYISNFRQNLSGQPAYEAELERREAEVRKYREFLDVFQQQSTSAQITRAIQASQLATRIEVRDSPAKPLKSYKPNRNRLKLIFVFLGLAVGLGLVFLEEFLDRSFRDVKDVESTLGITVLGTIPALGKGLNRHSAQRRKANILWFLAMFALAIVVAGGIYVIKGRSSMIPLVYSNPAEIETRIH